MVCPIWSVSAVHQAVTVPGASEHQIGLALDIVCNDYMSLDEGLEIRKQENGWQPTAVVLALFYDTLKARKTSRESNMNLAFSLCGKAAATVIMEQGISLEEFWEEYVEDVSID